jgi:hypothetical protein
MTLAVREDISCCEERGGIRMTETLRNGSPSRKKSVLSLEWLTAYII